MIRRTVASPEEKWRSEETARLLREPPQATIAPHEATRALTLLADAIAQGSERLRRQVLWFRATVLCFFLGGTLVVLLGVFPSLLPTLVSSPMLFLMPFLTLGESILTWRQRRFLRRAAVCFAFVMEGAAAGPMLVVLAEADRVLRDDVFPIEEGWEALARLAPRATAQDLQSVPVWALAFLAGELSGALDSTNIWWRPLFGAARRNVYRERPAFLVTALLLLASARFPDGVAAARRLAREFPDERVREAARAYLRSVGEAT